MRERCEKEIGDIFRRHLYGKFDESSGQQLDGGCSIGSECMIKALAEPLLKREKDVEFLKKQIGVLADFILAKCKGYPNKSEGACECAVTIISDLQEKLKAVEAENKLLEKSSQARNGDKICFWVPREEYIEMEEDVKSLTYQLKIAREKAIDKGYADIVELLS